MTALTSFQGSHTRKKNEHTRGTFFGIHLGTTKADMAEAILEGICFEMKDILTMKEELAGNVKKIRLTGGVSKSPMWCQMFADILNRPVELTEVSEIGSLGAAMCAGIGAGLFKDSRDAVDKCVHISKVYEPKKENNLEYEKAFKLWNKYYDIANDLIYTE